MGAWKLFLKYSIFSANLFLLLSFPSILSSSFPYVSNIWAMFYVEKFTLFNSLFIGLIYFIIQQIDNYLRQIVDFIFLPFFLDFFSWLTRQKKMNSFFSLEFSMDNQASEKIYIPFLSFFFPSIFPLNFLSLAFSWNQT